MRCCTIGLLFLSATGLIGCSGKPAPSPDTGAATPAASGVATNQAAPAPQPIFVPPSAAPDQVVTVFLSALRAGDSPTTESLLTARARQELDKHDLSVDVQSAPNASYQVRPAELLQTDPNGAHVSSVWTEKFDDGDETYEIVWALRRQAEG